MEAIYVLVESLNRLWYIPHMQNNIQPLKIKMLIHVICGYSNLPWEPGGHACVGGARPGANQMQPSPGVPAHWPT